MHNLLNQLVTFLQKPVGFFWTLGSMIAGFLVGLFLEFEPWMAAFTLYLSILAIVITGLVLVAGARSETAIQCKLDELIRSHKEARDDIIGLERRSDAEIEAKRNELDLNNGE